MCTHTQVNVLYWATLDFISTSSSTRCCVSMAWQAAPCTANFLSLAVNHSRVNSCETFPWVSPGVKLHKTFPSLGFESSFKQTSAWPKYTPVPVDSLYCWEFVNCSEVHRNEESCGHTLIRILQLMIHTHFPPSFPPFIIPSLPSFFLSFLSFPPSINQVNEAFAAQYLAVEKE